MPGLINQEKNNSPEKPDYFTCPHCGEQITSVEVNYEVTSWRTETLYIDGTTSLSDDSEPEEHVDAVVCEECGNDLFNNSNAADVFNW
jgi:predicted RNA-binding Zn-ribbon protein involved in translation (DUF1610 family)